MSRNRQRNRPYDPAKAEKERQARKADLDRLQAQPDVRVTTDTAKRIVSAQRLDVFELLHSRRGKDNRPCLSEAQFGAVRRLEADMAAAAGVDKPEQSIDRVQGSANEGAPGQNVSQRMVDASARVADVLKLTGPTNTKLLLALLEPQFAGVLTRWRDTVEKVTGEKDVHAAGALIRMACENLAEAYKQIDYEGRKAA